MKTIYRLILFSILLLSCKNDDDSSNNGNPIDQLPPATQTGAGIFGCLINGEAFVDTSGNFNCFYQLVDGAYYFYIGAEDNVQNVREIELFASEVELIQGETYILESFETNQASGFISFNDTEINATTINENPGFLEITKLDFSNNIISGVFNFQIVHPITNQIINVTEGRFDSVFTQ